MSDLTEEEHKIIEDFFNNLKSAIKKTIPAVEFVPTKRNDSYITDELLEVHYPLPCDEKSILMLSDLSHFNTETVLESISHAFRDSLLNSSHGNDDLIKLKFWEIFSTDPYRHFLFASENHDICCLLQKIIQFRDITSYLYLRLAFTIYEGE